MLQFSVQNRCIEGLAEVNMAQILWGMAKEYLSQIGQCQAKARQFYGLYYEQLTNLSKTDHFEVSNCQVLSKSLGLVKILQSKNNIALKIIQHLNIEAVKNINNKKW